MAFNIEAICSHCFWASFFVNVAENRPLINCGFCRIISINAFFVIASHTLLVLFPFRTHFTNHHLQVKWEIHSRYNGKIGVVAIKFELDNYCVFMPQTLIKTLTTEYKRENSIWHLSNLGVYLVITALRDMKIRTIEI